MLGFRSVVRTYPILKVLLPVALSLALFTVGFHVLQGISKERGDYAHWRERIVTVGPVEAYEELARSIEGLDPISQHSSAHTFGGALYKAMGEKGLFVCDDRFLYGCLHEFVGVALVEQGTSHVQSLNEACLLNFPENARTCQHGLGHGLLAFFGYSERGLKDALAICSDLPENSTIAGCRGGIFMEYNLRNMLGPDRNLRKSANPLSPCDRIEAEHHAACMYWIPQWWRASVYTPDIMSIEEAHKQMGSLCNLLTEDASVQRACYMGIGANAAELTQFNAEEVSELCSQTSVHAVDVTDCVTEGAFRMVSGKGLQEAIRLCNFVEEETKKVFCAQMVEEEYNRRVHFFNKKEPFNEDKS